MAHKSGKAIANRIDKVWQRTEDEYGRPCMFDELLSTKASVEEVKALIETLSEKQCLELFEFLQHYKPSKRPGDPIKHLPVYEWPWEVVFALMNYCRPPGIELADRCVRLVLMALVSDDPSAPGNFIASGRSYPETSPPSFIDWYQEEMVGHLVILANRIQKSGREPSEQFLRSLRLAADGVQLASHHRNQTASFKVARDARTTADPETKTPPFPLVPDEAVQPARYPLAAREDDLFLEWVDVANATFEEVGACRDDLDTPREVRDVIARTEPRGLDFSYSVIWELRSGSRKLLRREQAARLLKRFDDEPQSIHAWGRQAPPRPDLLKFEQLPTPWSLADLMQGAKSIAPSKIWQKKATSLIRQADAALVREQLYQWLTLIIEDGVNPTALREISQLWHVAYQMTLLAGWRDEGINPQQAARLAFVEHDFQPIAPIAGTVDTANIFDMYQGHPLVLSKTNATLARGAVWLLTLTDEPVDTAMLERLALTCMTKYDQGGTYNTRLARSQVVTNACIYALGLDGGTAAVMAMGRIRRKVRDARVAKMVDKAMAGAAQAAGMSVRDLEEIAVPDFDLGGGDWTESANGNGELRLALSSTGAQIEYISAGGKRLKSVPPTAKKSDAYKEMKAAADEISKMLPVLKERIEASWLTRISWHFESWLERYGAHPVAGLVARPLIWWVTVGETMQSAIWRNGKLVDVTGKLVPVDGSTVRLWHPIEDIPENIQAWRRYLVDNQIVQPLKQAHREVYFLTDAERQTRNHSNRFAAHILKQHQYMALARTRGWKTTHRMWVDAPNDEPICNEMPAFDIWAEIFIEGAGGDDPDTLDSGAYVYVSTDQVRFHRGVERLDLADVPLLVFSEVMRDCDLFVGVASIGNDPNWIGRDGDASRPSQWHRDAENYWHQASFGELAESAKLRRDLISEILPSLAIAPQCRIEDRFIRVEGRARAYKIHFNSGNILMEPNDSYLCIVPEIVRKPKEQIFIPFDGDRMLSIILSKAIMLAEDHKIKDKTILSQIT